jgi:Recombination endonuclease VII
MVWVRDPVRNRIRHKVWYEKNRERILARMKKFREEHKEAVAARSAEATLRYRSRHRETLLKKDSENQRRYRLSWSAEKRAAMALVNRNGEMKRLYRFTLADRRKMFAAQEGKCAMCGRPEGTTQYTKLHVDHCHKTQKVRALLCGRCNVGIGHMGDDPQLVKKAAAYLLAHSEPDDFRMFLM